MLPSCGTRAAIVSHDAQARSAAAQCNSMMTASSDSDVIIDFAHWFRSRSLLSQCAQRHLSDVPLLARQVEQITVLHQWMHKLASLAASLVYLPFFSTFIFHSLLPSLSACFSIYPFNSSCGIDLGYARVRALHPPLVCHLAVVPGTKRSERSHSFSTCPIQRERVLFVFSFCTSSFYFRPALRLVIRSVIDHRCSCHRLILCRVGSNERCPII